MSDWILPIILAGVGFFFVISTYGALLVSRKTGHHVSGFPCLGGVLILVGFLLSPCKWLALLCLTDIGFYMLPYAIIKGAFRKK